MDNDKNLLPPNSLLPKWLLKAIHCFCQSKPCQTLAHSDLVLVGFAMPVVVATGLFCNWPSRGMSQFTSKRLKISTHRETILLEQVVYTQCSPHCSFWAVAASADHKFLTHANQWHKGRIELPTAPCGNCLPPGTWHTRPSA